jgi:hypothetical protein
MKIFDPEDFAQGGRAGYAVGNQVTPQVDARMNLDYNTLVDQNQAQAATQAKNRKPFKQNFLDRVGYTQHMNEDRMLKDANIENQLMNRMGGLNVTQANPAFGLQNPLGPGIGMTMLGGAAGAYQGIQSLAGALGLGPKQSLGEMVKDTYENTMGQTILANPKQLEMYNKALSRPTEPVVDQDRISEIVEQQKAAGVPDEGLITNFQQDDGSSVIPNFEKLSDGSYKDTRSGDIYGAETYASIAAGMYPNIYDPNSQTLAQGGRAGYYTGGMVDVEPNLSDIGHGSDALMARTRLVSPVGS